MFFKLHDKAQFKAALYKLLSCHGMLTQADCFEVMEEVISENEKDVMEEFISKKEKEVATNAECFCKTEQI